jgi:peptidylprolyl isomerase
MRLRAALVALPLLAGVLVGCSSGPSQDPTSTSSSDTAASSATDATSTSEGPPLGPEVPPATAVAAAVPAAEMPTATGAFGEKPTLTFPATPPPSLQRQVLVEGTGPAIEDGDWLVTNYLGQIWNGAVFDNSYDRGATSAFQLGSVVPGWNVGLVGVPVGSRVLLSLPPADGYGSAGNSSINVTGTDTLVFVIDIVGAFGPDAGGQTDAVAQPPLPADGPQVTGALGVEPALTVPSGAPEPTASTVTVIAQGTGPAVADGQVLAQYVAVGWDGSALGSTWPIAGQPLPSAGSPNSGPQQLPVAAGGPFEKLAGVPVGSRVLVQIPGTPADPASGSPAQPSVAAVIDVLAQT